MYNKCSVFYHAWTPYLCTSIGWHWRRRGTEVCSNQRIEGRNWSSVCWNNRWGLLELMFVVIMFLWCLLRLDFYVCFLIFQTEEDLWVPASCNPCVCNMAVVLPFKKSEARLSFFFSLCNHYQTILTNELLMLIIVLKKRKDICYLFLKFMNHQVPEWLTYDFPPAVKAKVNRLWGGEWHGQAQKWLVCDVLH